jgi:hypothetical protein
VQEKYVMLSTVAVAPALAVLRLGEFHAIPYFPRYRLKPGFSHIVCILCITVSSTDI